MMNPILTPCLEFSPYFDDLRISHFCFIFIYKKKSEVHLKKNVFNQASIEDQHYEPYLIEREAKIRNTYK